MDATYQLSTYVGQGNAYGHHGELIQGVFADKYNNLIPGLVTLPFQGVFSHVTFHPDGSNIVQLNGVEKLKSKKAAELTGEYIYGKVVGGKLDIKGDVPIGKGLGSSTTDVVSSIKAVAGSLGKLLTNHEVAKIAVRAEMASDSIMFTDQSVLFAQRRGEVLKYFEGSLPSLHIVGFDTAESTDTSIDTSIDTLSLNKPSYTSEEHATFQIMIKLLNHAIQKQDPWLVGRAATASSKINQKYLPKPNFNELLNIVHKNSGLGIQVAHSGTIAGIMFNPCEESYRFKVKQAMEDLHKLGYESYEFQV